MRIRSGALSHWVVVVVLGLAAMQPSAAQETKTPATVPPEITIAHKPGREDGTAQMVVEGKVRKVAPHAVAAWRVRGGEGALVIVLEAAKGSTPKKYVLRYYDLGSGRRRVLGSVPLKTATLKETDAKDERWAFTLSGRDMYTSRLAVLVGDDQAIPGFIRDATSPAFGEDSLRYLVEGATREAKLNELLGTVKGDIYAPPQGTQAAPKLLQVFPNGSAMAMTSDGVVRKGIWHTDGQVLELQSETGTAIYSVPWAELGTVKGIPAGKRFGVRLLQELSSQTTHEGAVVKAVSITPIVVNGEILIPAGSTFEGKVVQADSTGWGFKHERASLTIEWTKATLQDGRELAMEASVYDVENAQESVNQTGKIQGIRSTGTPGHTAQNGVLAFAGIDPVAYIFASSSGSAVLGFAEPEILYHAGTELILENTRPLLTSQTYPPSVAPWATTPSQREDLQAFVKTLPYRTKTKGSNKDSDITNLVFVGSPAGLMRAFTAAGWVQTDELNATSTFRTIKTMSGNQTYTQAPMSVLLLNERDPIFTLSKTTNTFASRHHLRIFPTTETRDGQTVLTASSTQDIGIAFSKKQKTFIHVIDEYIDNERAKIVNDLMFTGCVQNLDLVPRPWVPRDAYNSTGDRLLTDGQAAVLRIGDCQNPRTTPTTVAPAPPRQERIVRDTSLTIRSDLYRGNLIYQGIAGTLAVRKYFRSSSELPEDPGAWRMTDASGEQYEGFDESRASEEERPSTSELHRRQPAGLKPTPSPEDLAAMERARERHKWDPPKYEFALQGGYMHMHSEYLSAVGVLETSSNPNNTTYFLFMADNVGDGWGFGGSVTVNSWRHFSNEFAYFRQQVKYELDSINLPIPPGENVIISDSDLDADRIGLVTRQFEYNLLMHPTRPTSRWRPYAAVGPVLQLVALNGAPLKKPAGVYTLGLKNIGLIQAAFDFGRTPPLDGGGIFHLGLQYGGGVKFRVTPRLMLRADWRQTWAKNPDIIADSYEDYDSNELDETYTTDVIRVGPEKKFIKDRFTLGVAFTF
jgi:opacity protein-like surface antigen